MCDVDDEDFADMLRELRGYDPKPGLRFGGGVGRGGHARYPDPPPQAGPAKDGSIGWDIALNPATLPRLVVNRSYYVELRTSLRRQGGARLAGRASWPTPTG